MEGRLEHDMKIQKASKNKLVSMPECVSEYYDFMKASRMTEATCYDYLNKIDRFLTDLKIDKDKFKAETIKSRDITKYLNSLDTKIDKKGNEVYTSDSYKQGVWICLNKFMQFLVDNGYAEHNYVSDIRKPKINDQDRVDRKRVRMTTSDFKEILKAIDNNENYVARKRDKAMISLIMTTGARESSVSEINVSDVNLEKLQISSITKGRKVMTYSLSETTAQAIKEWLDVRDRYVEDDDIEALFVSNRGQRIAVNSIAKAIRKYTRQGIGKELSPHKLRGGYCTILYEKTGDLEFVRRSVGHASVNTTMRYCVSKGTEREEAAKLILTYLR